MRGDFVTISLQGDFGKPRPALVVQSDQFNEHASVTVLPVTGTVVAAPLLRVTVQPDARNGLQKPSQVMVDKAMTVKRDKVGPAFGRIGEDALVEIERCLALFLGIANKAAWAAVPARRYCLGLLVSTCCLGERHRLIAPCQSQGGVHCAHTFERTAYAYITRRFQVQVQH